MIDAIVYNSKSGHTLTYAKELALRLGLPIYTIRKAKRKLKRQSNIIFMSWVCEDKIVGYDKVLRFHIDTVIACGIYPVDEEMISRVKNENIIYSKFFYLRGGINKSKLGLRKKIALKAIENRLDFKLKDSGLIRADQSALDAIVNQKDYTDLNSLDPIVAIFDDGQPNFVA